MADELTIPGAVSPQVAAEKRAAQIQAIGQAADAKGGVNNPDGRIALLDAWKAEQPQNSGWKALGRLMMGDKQGAALMAGLGRNYTKQQYGADGKPYISYFNEANPDLPLYSTDADGNLISPEEYRKKAVGFYKSFEDTPAGKAQIIETEKRKGAYELGNQVANVYAAGSKPLRDLNQQAERLSMALGELDSETLKNVVSYANKAYQQSSSYSRAAQDMRQGATGKQKSEAEEILKSASAHAGLPGVIGGAGGQKQGETKSGGESSSTLAQIMDNINNGTAAENAFKQGKEELLKSAWYGKLKPEQQRQLEQLYDTKAAIAKMEAKIAGAAKEQLPFLKDTAMPSLMTHSSNMALQSIVGQFNADAAEAYAEWRSKLKFSADNLPSSGQLEKEFSESPIYEKLQDQYRDRLLAVEEIGNKRAAEAKPPVQEKKPKAVGVPPIKREAQAQPIPAKPVLPTEPAPSTPGNVNPDRVRSLVEEIKKQLRK